MRNTMLSAFAAIAAAMPLATDLTGQCTTTWLPGLGVPGADGDVVAAINWDPDGPGPLPTMLVAAGSFTVIGSVAATSIAMMDPATGVWSPVGPSGTDGYISALDVLPNGTLVAGGYFSQIGGVAANNIAQFVNGAWQPLGAGVPGSVHAVQVMPTGQITVGGSFVVGLLGSRGVLQWNGTGWSPVGSGLQGALPIVYALALDPAGNLIAGGRFDIAGSRALAQWNGAAWTAVGGGVTYSQVPSAASVSTLTTLPSGDLLVGGWFDLVGATPSEGLASWNGTTWTNIGVAGVGFGQVATSSVAANGDVLVGGYFGSIAGVPATGVARRSAATGSWSALGASPQDVHAIAETSTGSVFAGGWFREQGPPELANAALWNGATWSSIGAGGFVGQIEQVLTLQNGDRVIGGSFQGIGGVSANAIARWDGTSWSALDQGSIGSVFDLVEMPGGDLVAAGTLLDAGGQPIPGVARWNGLNWTPLGAGLPMIGGQFPLVTDVDVLSNGDLIAVGYISFGGAIHGVLRWDGTSWSTVGTWPPLSAPSAVCELPNGNLVATGKNANQFAVVRVWDGNTWTQLGATFAQNSGLYNSIRHLGLDAAGDLIAGGRFSFGSNVPAYLTRWDGTAWQPIGSGVGFPVLDTLVMPNGDLFAVGEGFGSSLAPVARFDGNTWTAVNTIAPVAQHASIRDVELTPDGDLLLVGAFSEMGGQVSSGLATLRSTCPASVVQSGAGCVGSGGLNELRATSLPWIGSTFTSQALGLQSNGLAVTVLGLATSAVSLPSILPQALPGCSLLATPTILGLEVNAGTTLTVSVALPNAPALISQQMHQQIVPFELNGTGSIVAVTSTNRLTMTFGVF